MPSVAPSLMLPAFPTPLQSGRELWRYLPESCSTTGPANNRAIPNEDVVGHGPPP